MSIIEFDPIENIQDEKTTLVIIIGTLSSLINNSITIREAEQLIFSPRTIKYLKSKNIDENIIDLIETGCEIEDIYALLPNKYHKYLIEQHNKACALLKSKTVYESSCWIKFES